MTPTTPSLIGNVPIAIKFVNGTSGAVVLRRLSIRQLHEFATCIETSDTPEIVALCANQPIEWVDTLADESFAELSAACMKANFTRVMVLAKSDPTIAAKMLRLLSQVSELSKIASENSRKTSANSNEQLPAPALSESATVTGSESST
jgi:hypothetical protein